MTSVEARRTFAVLANQPAERGRNEKQENAGAACGVGADVRSGACGVRKRVHGRKASTERQLGQR